MTRTGKSTYRAAGSLPLTAVSALVVFDYLDASLAACLCSFTTDVPLSFGQER